MADLIRVALIDDDAAVLDSLALYLRRRSMTVTTFAAAKEFLTAIAAGSEFDCVVSDVRMPGTTGLELRQALVDHNCTWPLLLITGHGDIDMAVFALKAGAFDFIPKPVDDRRLLASIKEAVKRYREKLQHDSEIAELERRYGELSDRQRDVMGLAIQGLSNKEIAARLEISPRTVEHYREWAMERMHAASFAELVQMAMRLQLLGERKQIAK
jgi:FixJ family two-component response regulator